METIKVFNAKDYSKLKAVQRTLHDLLPKLDDAEACGIDCSAVRGIVQEALSQSQQIEQRFMTPIPTK